MRKWPYFSLDLYLSKQYPNEFVVSIASFKSSSIQLDVHFVNYVPISFKLDNKAGYDLGRGYLVIEKLLPQQQHWLGNVTMA